VTAPLSPSLDAAAPVVSKPTVKAARKPPAKKPAAVPPPAVPAEVAEPLEKRPAKAAARRPGKPQL
jgi:hypothetical protein